MGVGVATSFIRMQERVVNEASLIHIFTMASYISALIDKLIEVMPVLVQPNNLPAALRL